MKLELESVQPIFPLLWIYNRAARVLCLPLVTELCLNTDQLMEYYFNETFSFLANELNMYIPVLQVRYTCTGKN